MGKENEGDRMTIIVYRKKKYEDTWHLCRNCSDWPATDYEELYREPTTGVICFECMAKKSIGDCR